MGSDVGDGVGGIVGDTVLRVGANVGELVLGTAILGEQKMRLRITSVLVFRLNETICISITHLHL